MTESQMTEMVELEINEQPVKTEKGTSILEAAEAAGIRIPTLCHDENLSPGAVCRLCTVEITKKKRTRLVTSCVYPAEEGLIVNTDTERVRKLRRLILELILPICPSGPVESLAREYGVEKTRFPEERTDCILCGLCTRYCKEVRKADALTFIGRGTDRKIALVPQVASDSCFGCEKCYDICPGGRIIELVNELYYAPKPKWLK